MKILLLGEASLFHSILKRGMVSLGHEVTLVSGGCSWHDAPRDIDLKRDMRWGKFGGLKTLWTVLRHWRVFVGNDIVQMHNYQFLTLGMKWNMRMISFLKKHNGHLLKCCLGDDPQTIERQLKGVPEYSEIYWSGRERNMAENRERIAEQRIRGCVDCWKKATELSEVLVAGLYEYYLNYDEEPYSQKLRYIPLPIDLPSADEEVKVKGEGEKIKVLVGVQPERDYIKGARKIASWLEEIDRQEPGRLDIKYVENVPYDEYCRMLSEADVQVDQLYSYTPSLNSLAAMARGTVVIGGGEEDFYRFIGERELRPIINVRPDRSDDDNISVLKEALLTPGNVAKLSRESVAFVNKYYSVDKVAKQYEALYEELKVKG